MEEQRPNSSSMKRQRWSGLWNGVVIGMGLSWLLLQQWIGIFPLVLGIFMEVIQRKRLDTGE